MKKASEILKRIEAEREAQRQAISNTLARVKLKAKE